MKVKVAFFALRPFDEQPILERYSKQYGIEYTYTSEYPNESNLSIAEGCQAFCCPPCTMTEEWIDRLHEYGVKYFFCRSIGFDHLPLEYMKKYGMLVSAAPYPPECVANYAIMLMLMTTRKMNQTMIRANIQDYTLNGKMGRDISGLTVGVIGTGHIGATVIRHLQGFGCRILCYNRHPNAEIAKIAEYVDLDTLYKESDVISLHMASNASTFHLIDAEAISKMKEGVIIVNTARGTLIDTNALIDALESGKVGGAGLDVYEDETPLFYIDHMRNVIDNRNFNILRSMPNVICSPHNAFYVQSTIENMIEKPLISAKCYEDGVENPFQVN